MKRLGTVIPLSCALSFALLTSAFPPSPQSSPQSRELGRGRSRVALVVGNDAYTGSLAPLSNAVSDARAMGAALRDAGFRVTILENTNREALESGVQAFIEKLDRGDIALFYYSGHGLQVRGENYLAPVDLAARDVVQARTRSLNAMEVLDRMELAGTDLQIIILDACRNNPYGGRGESSGLAPMKSTGKGTFIAYSTAPGKTASDGTGKNGLYTSHLLESIRKPGLSLFEVFQRAGEAVQKASGGEQIPFMSSSVSGDFYFSASGNNAGNAPRPSDPEAIPAPSVELRYGSLAVSSDQGGTVSVDGKTFEELQPYAVLTFSKLPAGPHMVRVTKPGFRVAEQQVQVTPNQNAVADLKLLPLAPGAATPPPPSAAPDAKNAFRVLHGFTGFPPKWYAAALTTIDGHVALAHDAERKEDDFSVPCSGVSKIVPGPVNVNVKDYCRQCGVQITLPQKRFTFALTSKEERDRLVETVRACMSAPK